MPPALGVHTAGLIQRGHLLELLGNQRGSWDFVKGVFGSAVCVYSLNVVQVLFFLSHVFKIEEDILPECF